MWDYVEILSKVAHCNSLRQIEFTGVQCFKRSSVVMSVRVVRHTALLATFSPCSKLRFAISVQDQQKKENGWKSFSSTALTTWFDYKLNNLIPRIVLRSEEFPRKLIWSQAESANAHVNDFNPKFCNKTVEDFFVLFLFRSSKCPTP